MVHISGFSLLFIAIIAYKLGRFITTHVYVLNHYHIPSPVTGGLIASLLFSLMEYFYSIQIHWGFELRDQFLLIFFCTIGLNARFRLLVNGGKMLPVLFIVTAAFLILQNTTGILVASLLGETPIHGLLAGSISMAGGHGTAISWGAFFENEGYQGATEFALMAATMGLILGGLIGGPIAHALIKNYRLDPADADLKSQLSDNFETQPFTLCIQQVLKVILIISACVLLGQILNHQIRQTGMIMPDYLMVLLTAIVLINTSDAVKIKYDEPFINLFGDICLEMFITMSLMSLNLMHLAQTALPAFIIVLAQSFVISLFAYTLMFRAAGQDYDASLISSGFIGLGLGATPVGLANVNALVHRFGPCPKAFLIVPLLGSVFTDTLNAVILQGFLILPIFN